MLLLMQPRIQLAFWAASAHCRLMLSFSSTSTPKSFSGLLSSHSPPSLYLCLGLPRPTLQDPALGLVELYVVHAGPPLQPVKVPLNGIPSLQRINHTTQLGVVGKLAGLSDTERQKSKNTWSYVRGNGSYGEGRVGMRLAEGLRKYSS